MYIRWQSMYSVRTQAHHIVFTFSDSRRHASEAATRLAAITRRHDLPRLEATESAALFRNIIDWRGATHAARSYLTVRENYDRLPGVVSRVVIVCARKCLHKKRAAHTFLWALNYLPVLVVVSSLFRAYF